MELFFEVPVANLDYPDLLRALNEARSAHVAESSERKVALPAANLLSDLGLDHRERVHVRMLKWLLDSSPSATHEQGPLFLRTLLETVGLPREVVVAATGSQPTWTRMEWSGRYLDRMPRVDLAILWTERLVLFIEAKIGASESPGQLSDYAGLLSTTFPAIPSKRRLLIFLTPTGRPPESVDATKVRSQAQVLPLSWQALLAAFASAYSSRPDRSPLLERLLADFAALVKKLTKHKGDDPEGRVSDD